MASDPALEAAFGAAYGEVHQLGIDDLARRLEPHAAAFARGEALATGFGDLPGWLVARFKDLLRASGDEGASIWRALGEPETRHQLERMTHLAIATMASVQGLDGWTPVEIMTLLMLVTSYLHRPRGE